MAERHELIVRVQSPFQILLGLVRRFRFLLTLTVCSSGSRILAGNSSHH